MKRIVLMTLAAGAFALAGAPIAAQTPAAGPPLKKGAAGETQAYGYPMMTPAERAEWRDKMRAAKTPEERARLRDEHHAQMVERAREQGMTLNGPRGDPQVYGHQLMTPAERDQYMEKMRSATTRDERIRLRDEHRAEMQRRAQEKGVKLPEPRMGMSGGMGPGMGPGMGGGPGGGPGMRGPGKGAGGPANAPGAPASAPSAAQAKP